MIERTYEILNKDGTTQKIRIPDKSNCLSSWRDELQNASDKIKFDKCQEQSQTGYCCDAHPGCVGCPYDIPNDIYVKFGGKLRV